MPRRIVAKSRHQASLLTRALRKFIRMDGVQQAGAFAHYAFFSLFPLIVLFVTIASLFVDRETASREVISYIETYVPIGRAMQGHIIDTISGVVKARGRAGILAFVMLFWVSIQFFNTLICATNKAWGITVYSWWRLPLKSLVFLGILLAALLMGMAVPVVVRTAENLLFPDSSPHRSWLFALGGHLVPMAVMFSSLTFFYKIAPRRPTKF